MFKSKYLWMVIVVCSVVFWNIFIPGLRGANDFPHIYTESLGEGLNLPQTWNSQSADFGGNSIQTLWSWPISLLYGVGSNIGLNYSILERILGIFPSIFLAIAGIWHLLGYLKVGKYGKITGTALYTLNTYFILLVDGGQIAIALSYAFFPVAFIQVIKSIDKASIRNTLIAGLSISTLGFMDFRYILILFLLSIIYYLYYFLLFSRYKRKYFLSAVKTASISGAILVGLNLYWILPAMMTKSSGLAENYTDISQIDFLSFASFAHALFIQQPHWYLNVFGKVTHPNPIYIILPIVAFVSIILTSKNNIGKRIQVGFWLVAATISLFLAKGSNPPFGDLNKFLFTSIPGFNLFRDPVKFYILISLSYSILTAITFDHLHSLSIERRIVAKFVNLIPFMFVAYLVVLTQPVWTNQMTGLLGRPYQKEEFIEVSEVLNEDKSVGRILWIPSRPPLGFTSVTHRLLEARDLVGKRPFQIGIVGTYELYNFIRDADYMGQLFDVAGIKYIAYPYPDERRENLKEDNRRYYDYFSSQIENLYWIQDKLYDKPINLYMTTSNKDLFRVASNTYVVVGSDDLYFDLSQIGDSAISNNAFIFLEENLTNYLSIKNQIEEPNIILHNKNDTDLLVNLISTKSVIGFDDVIPNPRMWLTDGSDTLGFRKFLQEKYGSDNLDFDGGNGYLMSEGSNSFTLDLNNASSKRIFARIMSGSRSGEVKFKTDDFTTSINALREPVYKTINQKGLEDTRGNNYEFERLDFNWYEIGILGSDQSINIELLGELNAINQIAVINEEDYAFAKKEINDINTSGRIMNSSMLFGAERSDELNGASKSSVSYKINSPTSYTIKANNVGGETTVVFNESYDNLWRINGDESLPVFSIFNGFTISSDGEYVVEYLPQKYVRIGLTISVATLVTVLTILFISHKKMKKRSR